MLEITLSFHNDFIDDVAIQNCNYVDEDPNNLFDDFFQKLDGCVERHAPVKKLKPKEIIKLKAKPWINDKLFHTIKMKNKLFERKKRQPNNENVKILYNLFRNKVNRELSKSKKIILCYIF